MGPGRSRIAGSFDLARRNRNEDLDMKKKKKAAKKKTAKVAKAVMNDILVNDKVRVVEVVMKPGSESDGVELPVRVTRALKGGTLTRIFPGGRSEKIKFKTGEVRFSDAVSTHVVKNSGSGTIHLYSVFLK
jgi:hypothetical protein